MPTGDPICPKCGRFMYPSDTGAPHKCPDTRGLEDDWKDVRPTPVEAPKSEPPPPEPPPPPRKRSPRVMWVTTGAFLIAVFTGTIGGVFAYYHNQNMLVTEGRHHTKALQGAREFAAAHQIVAQGITCGWEPKDDWVACALSYHDSDLKSVRFRRLKCPAADRAELQCMDDGGY